MAVSTPPVYRTCRTPHGVRELKPLNALIYTLLPIGRTPHGVRELKHAASRLLDMLGCRTPHGVRELKLSALLSALSIYLSHPSRGA